MIFIHVILPVSISKYLTMLLILALIASSIHVATASHTLHYMSSNCPEKNSYITGSAFEANLNDTLYNQILPVASTKSFYNSTKGSGIDQVSALFYCKGDVDSETCQDCIDSAIRKIQDVCKFYKEGIIWFEECTLRYANRTIFSLDEEKPYFSYINNTGIVNDYRLDQYKEIFDSKMDALIQEAAYGKGTLQGFATKQVNLSSTEIIRGLAQCTPDIMGPGCYRCLSAALRLRDTWANTIIFLPSCVFRYDLYETMAPLTPPSSPQTLGALYIVLIVVLTVVLLLLAVIGGLWLRKHYYKGHILTVRVPVQPELQNLVTNGGDRLQRFRRYDYSQIEQMTSRFTNQLGRGGYGVVYHGRLLDGSAEVAIKMLTGEAALTQFNNEIDVFVKISHNNLVSLLGYCQDENRLALVYEYMEKGNLRAFLSENAGSCSWTQRLKIAIDIAEGLYYLHRECEVHIVHRDVKPANILLNGNLWAKLADFGSSKIFPKDVTTLLTQVVSTPGYTAPEYATSGLLNERADVYSFGVVLVELITGVAPRLDFDLVEWFLKKVNAREWEEILDPRPKQQGMPVPDERSFLRATELAKTCVEKDETTMPDMWRIVVELKECLNICSSIRLQADLL